VLFLDNTFMDHRLAHLLNRFSRVRRCGTRRGVLLFVSLITLCLSGLANPALAQTAAAKIDYNSLTRVFRIDAADVSYVFGINEQEQLQALYWGRRLAANDQFPAARAAKSSSSFDPSTDATAQEFVAWGGGVYVVPDLKITFPDGNRDLVLRYVSHIIDGNTLTIVLKDIQRDVFVTVRYEIDAATGVLARSARIENKTEAPFTIEDASSATWNLPSDREYELFYLTGRWAGEWDLQRQAIHPGKTVLESRRGSTGDENNPWFAVARGNPQDEDFGDVWFGALAWSGSWQIAIEQNEDRQVRITGGYTPFDFSYRLVPGECLQTPTFYGGYSHEGIGGASRLMHRLELTSIVPQAPHRRVRPVVYDSWEATGFDVDEADQETLAQKAASIGVERFVMDDGWFGQRKDDYAGLGDWYVNPVKFPHGLKPLIDKVHTLKMDFGLWVEPEMVNRDSDLYRAHPDWVLNFPGRPRTEERHQLVLNLARSDVRAYVYHALDGLLSTYDIAFLKWDYNRNWSEPGWPAVAPEDEKKVYVAYVQNLYGILQELRAKHPNVEIESCSGGGARVDLGIIHYTDEVWPSDNTDPLDRLSIQNGFSYAYAPGLMMAWVTDSPNWLNHRSTSLEFRFLSAMQGGLGIGVNLNKWAPIDFEIAKKMVAQYKQIRNTVQDGSLYRLISPLGGSEASVTESVSMDQSEAVVFAFLHSSQMGQAYPRIYPRGLKADEKYRVQVLDGRLANQNPDSASGAYWMQNGLEVDLQGDFQAALLSFWEERGL
jgi:alpha-galactosidase